MKIGTTLFLCIAVVAWQSSMPAKANQKGVPKNIILMIGDGMGLAQISLLFYENGKKTILEEFPVVGFQKTTSLNNLITDSAAAATAMACGQKTKNNYIGVDGDELPLKSIMESASESGFATGLVVTSSVQHATPAAFVAHQDGRNRYEDISVDFVNSGVDLIIGGGKQFFDRRESDDLDLTESLTAKGFDVFDYFSSNLEQIQPSTARKFIYFTADNQPLQALQGRDYLPLATSISTKYLHQRSNKGFFLLIEGSQIDWACHANQKEALKSELFDFENAVAQALKFAKSNGETLVIVTADHETGGLALNEGGEKRLDYKFTTNGHTGSMVPVFAFGPASENFGGIFDNTQLYSKMMAVLGLFSEKQ